MAMGHTIRKLRDARGWTQDELGRMTGAGDKYISALENGRRKPGQKLMTELCKAFGVTEQEIRFGAESSKDERSAELKGLHDDIANLNLDELLEVRLLCRRWIKDHQQFV